jgi:hypothetical protein
MKEYFIEICAVGHNYATQHPQILFIPNLPHGSTKYLLGVASLCKKTNCILVLRNATGKRIKTIAYCA